MFAENREKSLGKLLDLGIVIRLRNVVLHQLAQMIVTDHTKAGQDLAQTLSSVEPSVQAPTDVSATDQAHLDTLKYAENSFDLKYRAQMISTHVAAINKF